MKVTQTRFLSESKRYMKNLVDDLKKDYAYVSILGSDSVGTGYFVMKQGGSISDTRWTERGFVVRVYNGLNYSEYSFNQLDASNYSHVLERIHEIAQTDVNRLEEAGIDLMKTPLIVDESLISSFYGTVEKHPKKVGADEKIKKLTHLMNKGLTLDDRLIDFRVMYEEVMVSKIFLSPNRDLEQSYVYGTSALVPIVRKGNQVIYDLHSFSGMKGVEVLDEMEEAIGKTVRDVLELLEAKPIKPGMYEIICDPDVSGLIAHEAFGHGVEMDMFVKGRAKGQQYIGKKIASEKLVMHDGAKSFEEVASYLFDDEGVIGTDTVIIKDSLLQKGISDLISASRLGELPTGNGRRETFERKAYARMTNTFFAPGDDRLEDMIRSIDKGYLLEGFKSGMEDPKNWGIQCVLTKGREIIDGKFTGKIVSPVMLTGYVPDLLESISMISPDLKMSGSGACGKGYKEWVKTSTGGSYIKAVGRLG